MNSFAVLDSPDLDVGVKTRSKQRKKSKGKSSESIPTEVLSPKSGRKRKDKTGKQERRQETGAEEEFAPPSTSASPNPWDYQEPQPRWGIVGWVLRWIDLKIFQYNVTFGLYMLDRWERWLFNVCAFTLIFAVGYSSYKIAQPYTAALQESIGRLLERVDLPLQGAPR